MNNEMEMVVTTGNKRLDAVFRKALGMQLGGGMYELDAYNVSVLTGGISFTIRARVNASSDHFLLEVYEEDDTIECYG